jgi:sortase A
MSRFARPLLNAAIVAGLAIAAIPAGQTLYGLWSQRSLAAQWQAQKASPTPAQKSQQKRPKSSAEKKASSPTGRTVAALDSNSPAAALPVVARNQTPPWPLTKFSIPKIGLETFVVQGTDPPALRRGPGHDPTSSPPGTGNCVIAGHRNVYGSFFYRIDELMAGDPIYVENRDGKWTYRVHGVFTTSDTDLTVLKLPAEGAPPVMTLITCTLPHSNNRIILTADLSEE